MTRSRSSLLLQSHLLLLACFISSFLLAVSVTGAADNLSWEAPSSASIGLSDASWLPIEMDTMSVVNSIPARGSMDHTTISDRDLFELQSTMTGGGEIPVVYLNMTCCTTPVLYYSVPTNLTGMGLTITPFSTDTSAGTLGEIKLVLDTTHGTITLPIISSGMLCTTGTSDVSHLECTGLFTELSDALSHLIFTPEADFSGYASINWQLSSGGASEFTVLPTSGGCTITIIQIVNNPSSSSTGSGQQQNGLPAGTVRFKFQLFPTPHPTSLSAFETQLIVDIGQVLNLQTSRISIVNVTVSGNTMTVTVDFLPYTTISHDGYHVQGFDTQVTPTNSQSSQALYLQFAALTNNDVKNTVYLKFLVIGSALELCEDNSWQGVCSDISTSSSSDPWYITWKWPLIIGGSCLVGVILIVVFILVVIRQQRRARAEAELKNAPPLGGELSPAKKFVYTAPGEKAEGDEESMSEVTLHPQGPEFEPVSRSGSNLNVHEDSVSKSRSSLKNRISAKFPNKSPPSSTENSGIGKDGACPPLDYKVGGTSSTENSSNSSSGASGASGPAHFYYIDDTKPHHYGPAHTPSIMSHNSGTHAGHSKFGDSRIHFTIGKDGHELSSSTGSTGLSQMSSRPGSPVSRSEISKNGLSDMSGTHDEMSMMDGGSQPHSRDASRSGSNAGSRENSAPNTPMSTGHRSLNTSIPVASGAIVTRKGSSEEERELGLPVLRPIASRTPRTQ